MFLVNVDRLELGNDSGTGIQMISLAVSHINQSASEEVDRKHVSEAVNLLQEGTRVRQLLLIVHHHLTVSPDVFVQLGVDLLLCLRVVDEVQEREADDDDDGLHAGRVQVVDRHDQLLLRESVLNRVLSCTDLHLLQEGIHVTRWFLIIIYSGLVSCKSLQKNNSN